MVNIKVCLYIDENDPGEKKLLIQEKDNRTNSLNKKETFQNLL